VARGRDGLDRGRSGARPRSQRAVPATSRRQDGEPCRYLDIRASIDAFRHAGRAPRMMPSPGPNVDSETIGSSLLFRARTRSKGCRTGLCRPSRRARQERRGHHAAAISKDAHIHSRCRRAPAKASCASFAPKAALRITNVQRRRPAHGFSRLPHLGRPGRRPLLGRLPRTGQNPYLGLAGLFRCRHLYRMTVPNNWLSCRTWPKNRMFPSLFGPLTKGPEHDQVRTPRGLHDSANRAIRRGAQRFGGDRSG